MEENMKPTDMNPKRPGKAGTIVAWAVVGMIGTPVVLAWFKLVRAIFLWATG